MKKQNYTEIEKRIEARIAELEEEYELDTYDIQEIRDEEYRLGGWSYDPFPEIEEEEEEEEEEWHYRSLEQQLNEVGMRGTPKFCVKSNECRNRAKFICGRQRLDRLPPMSTT